MVSGIQGVKDLSEMCRKFKDATVMRIEIGKKNGFTLLEVIIVMLLVTLILGISTVFFAGVLPSARFSAAGREVSGVIRHARSLARIHMEKRAVIIDLDRGVYGIEGVVAKRFPPDARITIIDQVFGEISRGKYPIVFHPAGGVEGGTIIISKDKRMMRIATDPIVGAVVIK